MYGVSLYGSTPYSDSLFGIKIYTSYADLIAEVNITLLNFADLLAQTSIATAQSSDLPSKTQVATETFSDLLALVSNAVLGFNDLYSQISVGELNFSDLILQVPIAELLSEDLLSNVSVTTIGFFDIPAEVPVATKTFSDLLLNLSVSTKDFSDIPSTTSVTTEEFSDLLSKLSVSTIEFIDIPGVIGISIETFSDLLSELSIATIDFSDLSSQVTVPYFDFADLRVKTSIAQELSNDLLCQIETAPMSDINAQVTISNYKWLSPTLYDAQQQSNILYAFKCFVVDDSLVWNTNIGNSDFPIFGNSVMAPDGSLLVVGTAKNGNWVNGNLYFKKVINPSSSSSWTISGAKLLVTNGDWTYYNSFYPLPPAISVSDWINGTYVIDVYYWYLQSGVYHIKSMRSLDGGNTWFSGVDITTSLTSTALGKYMSISAGKPFLNHANNKVSASIFWLTSRVNGNPGSSDDVIKYAYYSYIDEGGSQLVRSDYFSQNYIDRQDWTLSGLDVFYNNDFYYIVFSGYSNRYEINNKNFGLYLTKIKVPNGDLSGLFNWSRPKEIINVNSKFIINQSNFILPRFSFDGKKLYLTFLAEIVDIVDEMQNVNKVKNFYLCESVDFENFSYPTILADTQDNVFFGIKISNMEQSLQTFVPFGYGKGSNVLGFPNVTNFYLCNSGVIWEYKQNNIVADVSDYILGYSINETAGGPTSISIAIANADGQWYGVNPTMPNHEAIKKNSKIYLFQGYYTSKGGPEYAPKNVFYIDDIQQRITATQNDLTITGRDFYKNLKTTISKFTFNFEGSDVVLDNFDGSTLGKWSVQAGSIDWREGTCPQAPQYEQTIYPTSPAPSASTDGGIGALIALSELNLTEAEAFISINVQIPEVGSVEFYFNYIDQNNWIKLVLQSTSPYWKVYLCSNGAISLLSQYSSGQALSSLYWYPIYIRKYWYNTYDIYIGAPSTHTPYQFNGYNENYKVATISVLSAYNTGNSLIQTIALGNVGGSQAAFAKLFVAQYKEINSTIDLIKKVSTKAKIYNYDMPYLHKEYFDDLSKWYFYQSSGNKYTVIGNQIKIESQNSSAITYYTGKSFDDAEIEFKMKALKVNPTNGFAMDFMFRTVNVNFYQSVKIYSNPDKNIKVGTFINGNLYGTNLDITQEHTYRIGFNNSISYIAIDDNIVFISRTDIPDLVKNGYIGFRLYGGNLGVLIKDIVVRKAFNQVNIFSINPGDDIESALTKVIENQRIWIMSDLAGRMKVVLPDKNNLVTYYYGDNAPNFLLLDNSIDHSDKEYVNRVTVVGANNIIATVQDNKSIGINSIIRERVITDYAITTLRGALERANHELQHFNQMNTQPSPKLNNNVGSEIFDVVNLKDTSNPNASGFNSNVRVYNQTINLNGQTAEYSITLGLGSV